MHKVKFYLAGIFCLGIFLFFGQNALASSVISGTITKTDGTPIQGESVVITNGTIADYDYTDSNGVYQFVLSTEPISGNYTIIPSTSVTVYDVSFSFSHGELFYPQSHSITVVNNQNQTNNSSTNFIMQMHGMITGKIVDSKNKPLDSVSLYFWSKKNQSYSDFAGTNILGYYFATPYGFSLADSSKGIYQAYISKDGYLPKYIEDLQVSDNTALTKNIILKKKSYLSGKIKSKTGTNLSNIIVQAFKVGDTDAFATVQSNSNGHYRIELGRTGSPFSFGDFTSKGKYLIKVSTGNNNVYQIATSTITVNHDESNLHKNFTLQKRTASFRGTIRNSKNKVITGAKIVVNLLSDPNKTSTTYSNSKGKFSLPHLQAGNYYVSITKDGYVDYQNKSKNITKGTHQKIKIIPAGNISGFVVDALNKQPLYDIYVQVANASTGAFMGAYTDDNGYYVIENVPAGNRKVFVRDDNYVEQFYPNSTTFQNAKSIKVKQSKVAKNINFSLTAVTNTYK